MPFQTLAVHTQHFYTIFDDCHPTSKQKKPPQQQQVSLGYVWAHCILSVFARPTYQFEFFLWHSARFTRGIVQCGHSVKASVYKSIAAPSFPLWKHSFALFFNFSATSAACPLCILSRVCSLPKASWTQKKWLPNRIIRTYPCCFKSSRDRASERP